jgi:hypothetical protein
VRVERADGRNEGLATAYMFWFALSAMLPKVGLYKLPEGASLGDRPKHTVTENLQCSVCNGAGCSLCKVK